MSKKPRNKKNNNVQREYRKSRAFTSSYTLARLNHDPVRFIDTLNMRVVNGSLTLAKQFNKVKHYWTIMLVVGCRERNGKFKLVTDTIGCADKLFHHDLEEFLETEHTTLIDECKKYNTVEYIGWTATTIPKTDFDLELITELFDELIKGN